MDPITDPLLPKLLEFGVYGLAAWLALKLWFARTELAWFAQHCTRLSKDNRELQSERDAAHTKVLQQHATIETQAARIRMWIRIARAEGWTDDKAHTVALPGARPRRLEPPPLPPPLEPEPRELPPSFMDDNDETPEN